MKKIRLATVDDAENILAIYKPYITDTSYTFETEVPSLEVFKERINTYLQRWPWLVCEMDGKIAGYAYAAHYRERIAYQWCTESSIYVHDDFQQRGVARSLYTALFAILKMQGFRTVYAVINLPNEKSVALHERMGFTYFATYENVGYKLGSWKNVGWWQLAINDYDKAPSAPIPFSEMNQSSLPEIFAAAEKLLS
jgi:phosphinothricin acetyltransferase